MQSSFPIQLSAAQDFRTLRQTLTGKIFLAVSATAFVAICAHISVPLYFTPVPITLQTMAVILVGLVLGPALGASASICSNRRSSRLRDSGTILPSIRAGARACWKVSMKSR